MKKCNWSVIPGVVITLYFIYRGIELLNENMMFALVWLIVSVFAFYRTVCVFIGKPAKEVSISSPEDTTTSIRLKELDNLYDQGLITKSEYDEKRKNILNEL